MSNSKKVALCGMLSIASLQGSAVLYALLRFALEGTPGLIAAAPLAMLTFLVGLGLEVVGVLYLVVPGGESPTPDPATLHNDSGSER